MFVGICVHVYMCGREREREGAGHAHLFHTLVGDILDDLLRHLQTCRTHIPQGHPVQGQQSGQRVHCPTVLQVAHQSYLQGEETVAIATHGCRGEANSESVDGADLLADGEDVQQSLCWVFSNSISCVDDGAVGHSAGPLRCACVCVCVCVCVCLCVCEAHLGSSRLWVPQN